MSIGRFAPERRRSICELPRGQGGRRRTDSLREPGRALVEYAPQPKGSAAPVVATAPRHAPFLAQLIATAGGFPQTRIRRRTDPESAARAYSHAALSTRGANGRSV